MRNFNCLVLYINMDHETARNDSIRRALEMAGLPYERVPAIREELGQLGCLKSHMKALDRALGSRLRFDWVLILEDDAEWACPVEEALATIARIDELIHLAPVWLLYSDVNGPKPERHPDHDWIRIANGCCNAASSYIIRRDYIRVLKSSWEQSLPQFIDTIETIKRNKNASEGRRKQTRPLWWYNTDCHPWADLQVLDGWFVLDKYITYQNRGRFPSYNNMTTETFRREHQ
jgi:hypothetical protein